MLKMFKLFAKKNNTYSLVFVLFFAFLLRIILMYNSKGLIYDQKCFINWMSIVGSHGLWQSYLHDPTLNYPPLFPWILGLYREVLNIIGISPVAGGNVIRLLPILLDLAAIIFLGITSKTIGSPHTWKLLFILSLNPGLIIDSAVWGQIDMLHSAFMLASILLLPTYSFTAGVIYALALLTKFQAVIIIPIISVFLIKTAVTLRSWKGIIRFSAGFSIPLFLVLVLFAINGSFFAMVQQAYTGAVGYFPRASMNAMNFWYFLSNTNDNDLIFPGVTLKAFGLSLLTIGTIFTVLYQAFSRESAATSLLKASAVISFFFFMLPTEIHERYSIPALVFVIYLMLFDTKWLKVGISLTISLFTNLFAVLYFVPGYIQYTIVVLNFLCLYWIIILTQREFKLSKFEGCLAEEINETVSVGEIK